MIESDERDPNSGLNVTIYVRPVKNEFKTAEEGRPIFQDVEYIRISPAGDRNLEIDVPIQDHHKHRFPLHWARWQQVHNSTAPAIGTPLAQWPLLSASQAEELKALKFHTVDAIANASDQQIGNIGMIGGMAPIAFRERAKRFLLAAKDESAHNKQAEELAKLQAKDAAREAELELLREQMKQLLIAQAPKAKPGRKPKVKDDGANHNAGDHPAS